MNNTTENNKLIAEFLGFQSTSLGWFDNEEHLINVEKDNTFDDLKFHSNWNWLMEVVGKIENYNEYTSVLFFPQGCAIVCFIENGFSFSNDCNTKIEAVYNACIEFIKWCNKQK
jgi:hypothetical protein